uniref:NADH-ubiquinone oxidoreductase chain 4 n=1 Tax=Aacanthocnema dobsoni TaxID=399255 RepID=A0A344A203_9HEMI|nr:NADH dehydrogenase subunit 4 [Aacanthocnema dobsoni]AWU48794.1 NADH dehydrogenase subunit 4 [Aacanthocnema dobsoni]
MLEILISVMLIVVIRDWILMMNSFILFFVWLLFQCYDMGEYNLKMLMYLLTIWLILLMSLSVSYYYKTYELYIILIILMFFLLLSFYSDTLINFYLGFEMSVFPVLLIIYGWGYQPDRLEAGFYIMMYTVFFSLPFLMGIFYMEIIKGFNNILFYVYVMAFLVKLPMFGLHLWLPRAHVEAPVFGSMILAGIMLKLGGYGIIKVSFLIGDYMYSYINIMLIFSILGGVYLSCMCFVQSDMKMLVAYSSIVHMSIVLSGLFTFREMGLNGSIYLMVGHGFCSSGLFYLLGLNYNRSYTRSIYLNKGGLLLIPISTMWWFLFCSSNLSFPPCLNVAGELLLFVSILSWSKSLYIYMGILGVLSSMYSIYLFSFTQQGYSTYYFSFKNFTLNEFLLLSLHWMPLNLFILDLTILIL